MPSSLISVVIVCRNPGPRLSAALDSVWNQRGEGHEVVVIDGNSTDGTREWLEARRSRFGALISEPDGGIYEAMNKGTVAARGDWVLFLGADDRLADDTVFNRVAPVLGESAASVVAGEAAFDDGRVYRFMGPGGAVRRNFIHHQAAFYRRELFVAHGGFDLNLRVQADYDFNLRLFRAGVRFAPLAARVAVCGSGGLSDSGRWPNYREEIAVRHRHFPGWRCWLWDLGSVARCLRKKIVRGWGSHA